MGRSAIAVYFPLVVSVVLLNSGLTNTSSAQMVMQNRAGVGVDMATLRKKIESKPSDSKGWEAMASHYENTGDEAVLIEDHLAAVKAYRIALFLRDQLNQSTFWSAADAETDTVEEKLRASEAALGRKASSSILIKRGATWHFHEQNIPVPAEWKAPGFDDSDWPSNQAPLGYGDNWIRSELQAGEAGQKTVTYYFRKSFDVEDPGVIEKLRLDLLRDDGAVVYFNGTEVLRDNLPDGEIGPVTFASKGISGDEEKRYTRHDLLPTSLVAGKNTIAVEVHQDTPTSADLSFDLSLSTATEGEGIDYRMEDLIQVDRALKLSEPAASLLRAVMYEALAQPDDAIASIENALQNAPNDPYFKFARIALLERYKNFGNELKDYVTLMNVARDQKNVSALRKYIGKWWKLKESLKRPITLEEIPMTEKVTAPDELKNSYARIEIPMSWHQAVKICEELGGHLATVTTDKENRLLYQKFTNRQLCWLGGTDEKHNGTWRWVTGESFTYKKWYSGEPNNSGRIEHYLCTGNSRDILNPNSRSKHQFNFRWSDQSTDGSPDGRPFIYPLCEWESNPARLPKNGGNALLGSRKEPKADPGVAVPEKDSLPVAIPVKGRPGMVYSPFVKGKQIRVKGLPAGSKVLDPHSKKFFRIP